MTSHSHILNAFQALVTQQKAFHGKELETYQIPQFIKAADSSSESSGRHAPRSTTHKIQKTFSSLDDETFVKGLRSRLQRDQSTQYTTEERRELEARNLCKTMHCWGKHPTFECPKRRKRNYTWTRPNGVINNSEAQQENHEKQPGDPKSPVYEVRHTKLKRGMTIERSE